MILFLIFAALIGMTMLELYVVIQIGHAIGLLPTLALMVADAIVGSILMRSQGRAVWRRFNEALASRRLPAREVLDGALVIAGGAFLITPGFVTDIFGAFLLIPPTRAIARRGIVRHLSGRVLGGIAGPWARRAGSRDGGSGGGGSGAGCDVDGSAVEIHGPELGGPATR
jgi:UPF0716 protein FxsA